MLSIYIVTDIIIAVILFETTGAIISLLFIVINRKKRKLKPLLLLVLSLLFGEFIIWGSFIEPTSIIIKNESFDLEDYQNEKSIKAVLLADVHAGAYANSKNIKKSVEMINNIDADLVFIPGDFVDYGPDHIDELEPLKEINKPTYIVWGNHDYMFRDEYVYRNTGETLDLADGLEEKIESFGFTILRNDTEVVEFEDGRSFRVAGIDDLWSQRTDYSILDEIGNDEAVVLLCHNPDCVMDLDEYRDKVDLVLAGHTHGGQVRLPVVGSIAPQGLPIQLPRDYDQGYNEYEGTRLYITSGMGCVGTRARTFNKPEIVVIEIE